MFDNHNKVYAYKISLKLDQYLVALFNLCYDVSIKIENITVEEDEIFHASKLFKESFYNSIDININEYLEKNQNKYISSKDELFNNIAATLNNHYLKSEPFLNKLKNQKEYLYYFTDHFIIYSTLDKKREIENSLNDRFKSINVIADVVKNLENENLQASIQGISTIYDFNKVGQYIKVSSTDLLKPQLFYLNVEMLDSDLVDLEIFDNVWVNFQHDSIKDVKFDKDNDDFYLILDRQSRKVIGLKINDVAFLKYGIDIKPYVKQDFLNQYLWQLFEENLFRKKNQVLHSTKLIESFKEKSREADFNKLLCNLKHNLYFDRAIPIKDDYKIFFEEFIVLKELSELANFNFFVPDESEEKELLGIYTEKKIGEKYNLLHFLRHKDDKFYESYINSEPQRKDKQKVNILKAELSFYLVEKYYEDIIEDLLKELGIKYLTNVELFINNISKAEFDFVIFRNNQFYFIEAKTTLSKDNVYVTSKKYNVNIDYLKMITGNGLSDFKFVLMGLLSNANLDNYRHFFDGENYNSPREGYAMTPYKFNVPFFSHESLALECIAEPELLQLKEFIKDLCQI